MNSTAYDERKEVASIQPGATWGTAFEALAAYGVVPVGGRATPVGVGGFTTGGGYSFHTASLFSQDGAHAAQY
jgi:FAD/FMN-containing dehydrogenase